MSTKSIKGLRAVKEVADKVTVDWFLDNVDLTF